MSTAPEFAELPEVAGGRSGEQRTRRMLQVHHATRFGKLCSGKRVPRQAGAEVVGRYEIDFIVITPARLVAIETKNWSGRLRLDGEHWVHERRNGD